MEITCYDKYGRVIEKIVQWDVGQSISIKGYDLTSYAPQIHFANANSEKALVVESVLSGGLLSCQVPNSLARENLPIIMYIYDAVGETGKTNTIIKIPVTPRPMPDDVVYTDDVGVISLTEVLRQAREYMNNSLNYSTKAKGSADAAKVSETNAAKSESTASSSATQAAQSAKEAKAYVGSPLVANTVSTMTDRTKVYVYTGSESGYTAGNWYYHNGSAWVSGGVYNSSAVNVDKTLTQDGYAADAKVTGDAVDSLREDLDNMHEDLYVKTYNIFDVDFLPRAYISFASSHAGELFLDNNDNYSATNETINVLPNTQYTFSNGSESIPYELQLSVIFYDKDMRFLGYASSSINNSSKYFKFTTIDNTNHLRFQLRSTGKGSDIPNIKKWQLNEGDLLSYLDNYVLNFSTDNIGKELTNINIDNPQVRDFVKDVDYTNQEYTITQVGTYSAPSVYYRKDCGFPMVVKWKLNRDIKNQILYISTNHSIPIADTVAVKSYDIPCGISDFVVYNLIPNATYYYKVCGTDFDNNLIVIKEGAFTTIGQVHMLKIDGLKNVRDLGGWLTPNGKIKYGLLFRGCELDDTGGSVELTHEGKKELFDRIRIKTDIDLRTDVGNTKSPIGALVDYNCYPIQPYDTGLKDTITKGLIKSIFEKIEEKLSKSNAIYFHCQGGRDRTGTLAFLILGVLGVSESDIAKDYELTEFAYASYKADNPNTSRKFTQYASMVSYIKTFNGVTFNDKIISYLLSIGISQATINNIKSYMVA